MRALSVNLKSIMAASVVSLFGLLAAGSDAKAITWNLSDVSLSDGGTLSGTFTLNSDGYFGSYNLASTSGSLHFSETYVSPGPVAPNINTTSPPTAGNMIVYFPNDFPEIGALQLTFAHSLSIPGIDPIVIGEADSFECLGSYSCAFTGDPTNPYGYGGGPIWTTDTRFVESGDAVATPLPPTWTMLLIGLVGVGFTVYRRRPSDLRTVPA